MIKDTRVTVAELLALKGKRQLTELNVESVDEIAAAETAGIDIVTIREDRWSADMRQVAPRIFVVAGLLRGVNATAEDYLRASFRALGSGADAVYCAGSLETIRILRSEAIPVVGHVGLVPSKRTWTGGYRAVGKTAETAWQVLQDTLALEAAGAIAVEMELVPNRVAAAICKRTSMLVFSMGSGPDCDAQYLFARDILGSHEGHYPRHAKRYRDFRAEHQRLQQERIAAFSEFGADVRSGAYPQQAHGLTISDDEFTAFVERLEGRP